MVLSVVRCVVLSVVRCVMRCVVFSVVRCGAFWFSGGIIVRFKARNGGWSFNFHVLYFVSFVFIVIQKKYNGS